MLKSNLRTRRLHPSVLEVQAGAVKVALKEEMDSEIAFTRADCSEDQPNQYLRKIK